MDPDLETVIARHTGRLHGGNAGRGAVDADRSLPRVTIVTPSFNQAPFIERTILSVLNQDWPDLEYIIIDGASTDGTPDIIRKYEKHLAYWVSEPDSGHAEAIAKGLRLSTGKYVNWLCSDDILLPGSVERMVRALESRPDAGIVYGGVVFIDEDDRATKVLSFPDVSHRGFLYDRRTNIAQPSSLMRKATLLEAGGVDISLHYCIDYDIWIRLLKASTAVNLGDAVLSGYRLHTRSRTVGAYTNMALEKIKVNRRYTSDVLNKVIYAHYWYIVEDLFRRIKRALGISKHVKI